MSSEDPVGDLKYGGALVVTAFGLVVIAILVWVLPVQGGWKASEVIALVGSLTTVIGTTVGAFLGVQAGSAGKVRAGGANQASTASTSGEVAKVLHETKSP